MPDINSEFNQVWDARESIYAVEMARVRGVEIAQARDIVRIWVEIVKETHRKISLALEDKVIRPKEDLLDLFSGPAIVPYTLQVAGLVDQLTLLDRDEWNQFGNLHREMSHILVTPPPTVLCDNVTHDCTHLLPNIRQVTLIDTGLGLPDDDRENLDENHELFGQAQRVGISRVRQSVPDALTRGHVFELKLDTVLKLLRNAQRKVFIVEQAKKNRANVVDSVSRHLTRSISSTPGWKVSDVSPLDDDGMVMAELEHKVV